MAKQLRLERLSDKQRAQFFLEYSRQEHALELAELNQKEQLEFQHLVSDSQQERLIVFRANALKNAYNQRLTKLIKSGSNRKKPSHNQYRRLTKLERVRQPSLVKQYLDFCKKEETTNKSQNKRELLIGNREQNGVLNPDKNRKQETVSRSPLNKESSSYFFGTEPPKSPSKFVAWYYQGTASAELQLTLGLKPSQITPHGAVTMVHFIADTKRAQAQTLFKSRENQLRKSGVKITKQKSEELRVEAYEEIRKQWRKEVEQIRQNWHSSNELKSGQEQQDLSSLSLRERAAYFQQKYNSKQPEQSRTKEQFKSI